MAHWLDTVLKILEADTADLRKLAKIAGADPKTFYRGTRLTDVDVAGQDIDGMEFKGGRINQPQTLPNPTQENGPSENSPRFTAEAEFGGQRNDMDSYFNSIQQLMSLKRYQRAEEVILEAITLFPEEPIFFRLEATVYRRLNKADQLTIALETAYRKFPTEHWVILQYCFSLLTQDKINDAIAILKRALETTVNSAEILELLSLLARADKFEGIKAYRDQLAVSSGSSFNVRASLELADLYFQTLQFEEGLALLKILAAVPGSKKSRFFQVLSHALQEPEYQESAISIFRSLVEKSNPHLQPMVPFITGLVKSGLRTQTLDLLTKLGSDSLNPLSIKALSDAFWNLGEQRTSIALLERMVLVAPDRPQPIRWLIERSLETGMIAEAIFHARTVLQNQQKLPARLLRRFTPFSKEVVEVIKLFEIAHEQNPDDVGTSVILANAYSITGSNDKAFQLWSEIANTIKEKRISSKWIKRIITEDNIAQRLDILPSPPPSDIL